MAEKSLHSICRWTFNPGKGGFVPGDQRPEWGGKFGTPEMIKLVSRQDSLPLAGQYRTGYRDAL